jgi:hypothetical protein
VVTKYSSAPCGVVLKVGKKKGRYTNNDAAFYNALHFQFAGVRYFSLTLVHFMSLFTYSTYVRFTFRSTLLHSRQLMPGKYELAVFVSQQH